MPGDISSAAFWLVAASALAGSEVTVAEVGLNPTRTGIIDVLRRIGARVDIESSGMDEAGEPIGTVTVRHGELGKITIAPDEVPGVIDELPVLGALATHGGALTVTGAQELRVKESDRISALAEGFRRMGADIDEQPDGFEVRASRRLRRRRRRRARGSPARDGVRHRGPGRLRPDHHSRRRRRCGLISRVFLSPRVAPGVKADKLYLVGFMGAGKSTTAAALGRRIGWRAEDIDTRIETREHRSVAAIFAHEGEAYFRTIERQVLHELLPERSVVVAAGGGTFVEPDNRAVMLADGAVAWLDIPLSCVIDRVPRDGRRPLAADLTQLEQLYLRRRAAYADAHVRIDASRPAAEVVERLLEWIGY